MRVQAGGAYIKYVYSILYGKHPKRKEFSNYTFKMVNYYRELVSLIDLREKEYGLCRIASGYGFAFKNDKTIHSHSFIVDGEEAIWNTCTKGWIRKRECKNEIGSIYTLCGIDLNYAGVIVGPELFYDKKERKIKLDKKKFYDNTVKKQKSEEAIFDEVLNAYGILLTRGIKGTYIYVCDPDLREYLTHFISFA